MRADESNRAMMNWLVCNMHFDMCNPNVDHLTHVRRCCDELDHCPLLIISVRLEVHVLYMQLNDKQQLLVPPTKHWMTINSKQHAVGDTPCPQFAQINRTHCPLLIVNVATFELNCLTKIDGASNM